MTTQSRASVAELTAEFERAMGSLAETPTTSTSISRSFGNIVYLCDHAMGEPYSRGTNIELADHLVRIAAIALEGAARLRRGA